MNLKGPGREGNSRLERQCDEKPGEPADCRLGEVSGRRSLK